MSGHDLAITLSRRGALRLGTAGLAALALTPPAAYADEIINDVTGLNPIRVRLVARPQTIDELRDIVRTTDAPLSVAGGRYSQGGQIGCDGGVAIDMRDLNRILALDVAGKTIQVEAGCTWRQIQEHVDGHDLSPEIMQSYSNFTIGGSLSVNCHGDYVGAGPVIQSVRDIAIVLADGSLVTASRTQNRDIFCAAIGGYGAVGVIIAATLDLAENAVLERSGVSMPAQDYPQWRREHIVGRGDAVLHHGILYPPELKKVTAVVSRKTQAPPTVSARLPDIPEGPSAQADGIALVATTGFGKLLRRTVVDHTMLSAPVVATRNYLAADDVGVLEPPSREAFTYVLQEYFVPEDQFTPFISAMSSILRRFSVDAVNIAIRHTQADPEALLSWAPENVFSFVLYYRQATDAQARAHVARWTQELIQAAIDHGGRHYLPYQIHATREQFYTAYPGAHALAALKRRVDPTGLFRNRLLDAYTPHSD